MSRLPSNTNHLVIYWIKWSVRACGGTSEKSITHANDCYLPYFGNVSSLMTSWSLCDWDSQVLIEMTDSRTEPSEVSGNMARGLSMGSWERLCPLIRVCLLSERVLEAIWRTSVSDNISICGPKRNWKGPQNGHCALKTSTECRIREGTSNRNQ